jgi:hypothetical protein
MPVVHSLRVRFSVRADQPYANLLAVRLWQPSVCVPLMGCLPFIAAHELVEVSNEAAVLGDGDRYTGFRRNLSTALKTERMGFLRE